VEAIMKVVVNEVIVVMAMPICAMPSGATAIPARTTMPRGKARPAHRATNTTTGKIPTRKVGSTAEVASTHPTSEVASAAEASTTETVGGVRLLHGCRGKKQAARKGGYCKH